MPRSSTLLPVRRKKRRFAWGRALALFLSTLLALVGLVLFGRYVPSLSDQALGSDFVAFYTAAWLVLAGRG